MRCAALPCVLALVLTWIAAAKGKGGRTDCARQSYRKNVLKLVKEAPFAGLFRDVKNHTKFEASGVAAVRGHFYAVFDNSFALGRLDERFSFRGPDNALVGEMRGESQYEGIAYVPEKDTFLLLQEAAPAGRRGASTFRPAVVEVRLRADGAGYDQLARCDVDFELSHGNKGFESIAYLHTASGEAFLLGLCEGNFCRGGRDGADAGNGRIIVTRLRQGGEGGCAWEPVKSLHIPPGAHFRDYAAMAFNFAAGKLAILSQEDAAIWIGDFDVDAVEFSSQEGQVFHLPRDNHCEMVYCNGEGLQWLDNYRLLVASDKAKAKQPFWCDAKDQSIHIFAMPPGWDPYAAAGDAAEEEDEEEDERGGGLLLNALKSAHVGENL